MAARVVDPALVPSQATMLDDVAATVQSSLAPFCGHIQKPLR